MITLIIGFGILAAIALTAILNMPVQIEADLD